MSIGPYRCIAPVTNAIVDSHASSVNRGAEETSALTATSSELSTGYNCWSHILGHAIKRNLACKHLVVLGPGKQEIDGDSYHPQVEELVRVMKPETLTVVDREPRVLESIFKLTEEKVKKQQTLINESMRLWNAPSDVKQPIEERLSSPWPVSTHLIPVLGDIEALSCEPRWPNHFQLADVVVATQSFTGILNKKIAQHWPPADRLDILFGYIKKLSIGGVLYTDYIAFFVFLRDLDAPKDGITIEKQLEYLETEGRTRGISIEVSILRPTGFVHEEIGAINSVLYRVPIPDGSNRFVVIWDAVAIRRIS
ncbi:MAG: hypothetical protein RLZZ453_449 [Chlamydiota bacterium]|jgi:hypothetical protein